MEFHFIANVLCLQHDIVIPNTKTQCKISSLHERKTDCVDVRSEEAQAGDSKTHQRDPR